MNSNFPPVQSNILVVDDTPANLRLLTELLSQQGYDVRPALNGTLALTAAQMMPPDLILLDIMMPDLDGYEVCEQLKANDRTRHIPVIFISALDNPKDKVRAFEVGGVDYIPKPFQKEEILARVENQLRLLRANTALQESEERFRAVFANAGIGICILREDGGIVETNPAFEKFIGYDRQDLGQLNLLDLTYPEDGEGDRDRFMALWAGEGESYQIEKRYIRANGEIVWGRSTTCAVKKGGRVQFAFGLIENITERQAALRKRKEAEEALKASEAEMRAIFAAMTDAVIVRDRQGNCLKVAPTKTAKAIERPEMQLGKTLHEVLPQDTADRLHQAIQQTLEQRETTNIEYKVSGDRGEIWLDGRLSPLSEDTVVWVARDISERKLMEQKLRSNEAEIRGIFEAMTEIVLVVDREQENIQVMPTSYARFNEEGNLTIEATFANFFGDKAQPAFWLPIQDAITQQQTIAFEYSLDVNGKQIWFAASVSALSEQSAIWVARDISDRVRAEMKLQQLNDELEYRVQERTQQLQQANTTLQAEINDRIQTEIELAKSEERFRLAVDNIPDIFAIYDRHLQYQFANARALEVWQKTAEEMLGKTDGELFAQDSIQNYLPLLEDAARSRSRQTQECTFRIANGEERTFVMSYVPLLDGEGEIYQILGIAYDISDRKRSERALQEAKEQLQAVLDAVPGFVSWVGLSEDNSLQYLGANRQLAQAFQMSPNAFIHQPLGFFQQGKNFVEFVEAFFHSDETTIAQTLTLEWERQQRDYLIVAQKYQQEQTAVFVGIDITARVEAQKQLQRAYRRSQLLSELTLKIRQSLDLEEILQTAVLEVQQLLHADRVFIWQWQSGRDGIARQEAVLPGLTKVCGLTLQISTPETVSPPDFQPGNFWTIDDLSSSPTAIALPSELHFCAQLVVPIFIQEKTWGALIVHQCYAPHHWQSDEIELLTSLADQIGIAVSQAQLLDRLEDMVAERTGELQATNEKLQTEITERSRAEEALRESEKQLRRTIEHSAYGIVVCDRAGTICFFNAAAKQIFGRNEQQLLGFHLGMPLTSQQKCELSILRQDGSSCIVEMRAGTITWEGDASAYLISLVDITERKAVEQMKDEFISVASHELRTPLTSIRGSLGLLATGRLGKFEERGQQMLNIAINNTDRLTRLLNDILDLERIESGKVKIVKQHCNGIALMIQAAEAMQVMAEQAEISLCLKCDRRPFWLRDASSEENPYLESPPTTMIWADPDQILQTLTNLISNAIKFSNPRSMVGIGIVPQQEQILFEVKDRGRGIPKDKLESIFGRFQQVDASDSREKGGTGLGLPICREIIQRHQGTMWVESTVGKGSSFYFTLPLPPP
ncbi:PAS domain S-box protein [Spirulina sp. 06S082]|uniref:PAS domain S-box protein n=1 Tax=Spirulina sp. 06S082 TaxID=3110248 RepID=UPI002B1F8BA2|nr:PAS domain S-box protein [Spirulina sp. 06S082]MEA5467845.1 PAS domain S-box protein [Spirulina sp. 06S082]